MVRVIFFVIALMSAFLSQASQDSVRYYNEYWTQVHKKREAVYYRIVSITSDSVFKTDDYFMNGKILRTGFRTSLENECYVYRTGHYVFFDKDGAKSREGNYVNGMRNGKWQYYYPEGKVLKRVETYRLDTIFGNSYYFDSSSGKVLYEDEHKDGKTVRRWSYKNKDTTYTVTLQQRKISVETKYDKHGNIVKVTNHDMSNPLHSTCFDRKGNEMPCDTATGENINAVFVYVEKMPRPGYDYNAFLNDNIRYPKEARNKDIEGRVIVKFAVDEDGTITNVHVIRGVGGGCDEEAERVVSLFPPWAPGTQNGEAVRVHFTLPIVFKLQ